MTAEETEARYDHYYTKFPWIENLHEDSEIFRIIDLFYEMGLKNITTRIAEIYPWILNIPNDGELYELFDYVFRNGEEERKVRESDAKADKAEEDFFTSLNDDSNDRED